MTNQPRWLKQRYGIVSLPEESQEGYKNGR